MDAEKLNTYCLANWAPEDIIDELNVLLSEKDDIVFQYGENSVFDQECGTNWPNNRVL